MHNHKTDSQSILEAINRSNKILIIAHKKPDGDTLGSSMALYQHLKNQKKDVSVFCLDDAPANLKFLPNIDKLSQDHKLFSQKYDLVFAMDSANLNYAGVDTLITALAKGYTLVNIDHHISNPLYGDINLVLNDASSTAEVLYRLLKDWDVTIDEDMATAISCGMITDTGGFRNPATTYHCLYAAADLIKQGAKPHKIIQQAIKDTDVASLNIWGKALERLRKSSKYNLVYTWVSQEDFKNFNTDESSAEGIANFLHILNEGQVLLVLTEMPNGTIKGSMRTSSNINLSHLAGLFGGGGHRKAAGFSLPGRLYYDNNNLKII